MTLATQSTFDWPDLLFREGRPPRLNESFIRYGQNTRFANPRCPPSQGDGPPEPAIPSSRDVTGVRPPSEKRCLKPISATDLVVTSTLGATPFPGFRLSPIARRDHPRAVLWVGAQPLAQGHLSDAGLPLLALQPWIGCAVGAAPASCYRVITPVGMRGVPRCSPGGRFRPDSSPMIRLADAPCRYPQPVPGIPSPSARARTRFLVPQPKGASLRARGAFHQQVPPSSPVLAPESRPHGPPLVPRLCRRGPSFRHAFTLPPEER